MTVGERIKRERLKAGVSQRKLTAGLDRVSPAYLSRIEANDRDPSMRTLVQIAARLNTTALFLTTGRRSGVKCPCCGRR